MHLTDNFEMATGSLVGATIEPTRNEQDFAAHVGRRVATDPKAGWIFVADNLTTHWSTDAGPARDGALAIPETTPGNKGKAGSLKSVASRREFLSDPTHRIRFVYVSKHTS